MVSSAVLSLLSSDGHIVELDGAVLIPSMTDSAILPWLVVSVLTLDLIFSFSAVRLDMLT